MYCRGTPGQADLVRGVALAEAGAPVEPLSVSGLVCGVKVPAGPSNSWSRRSLYVCSQIVNMGPNSRRGVPDKGELRRSG